LPDGVEFSIKDIEINNVYPGGYFTPDKYSDLQMNSYKDEFGNMVGVYADLKVDFDEEMKKIFDTYRSELNSTTSNPNMYRQDLFNNALIMQSNNLVKKEDGWYVRDLILIEDGNGQRYETDNDGELVYKETLVCKSDYTNYSQSVDTSIIATKLLFAINDDEENKRLYVFDRESVGDGIDGYTTINLDGSVDLAYSPTIQALNPLEVLMLYRFTQIREVEYVIVELNPNIKEGMIYDGFSMLQMTVKYDDIVNGNEIITGDSEIYIYNVLAENNLAEIDYNCISLLYYPTQ
jgi:hypothetical protein